MCGTAGGMCAGTASWVYNKGVARRGACALARPSRLNICGTAQAQLDQLHGVWHARRHV